MFEEYIFQTKINYHHAFCNNYASYNRIHFKLYISTVSYFLQTRLYNVCNTYIQCKQSSLLSLTYYCFILIDLWYDIML